MKSLCPREDLPFPPQSHGAGDDRCTSECPAPPLTPCSWGLALQGARQGACCTWRPSLLAALKLDLGLPGTVTPPSTALPVRRSPALLFSLLLPADSANVVRENWLCVWSPSSLQCPFSFGRPLRTLLVALFLQQGFSAGKSLGIQLLAQAQKESQISPVNCSDFRKSRLLLSLWVFALWNLIPSSLYCLGCSLMSLSRLLSIYLAFSNFFLAGCNSVEVPYLLILKILGRLIGLHFIGGLRNDYTITWLENISMFLDAVVSVLPDFFPLGIRL